jgi:hypothetical protein
MNTKDTITLILENSVNRAPLRRTDLMLRRLTAVFLVTVGAGHLRVVGLSRQTDED